MALRAGKSEALPLSASPDVETILPLPVPAQAEQTLHLGEKATEWLSEKGAASAPDAQEAWVLAFADSMLDHPVAALGPGPSHTLVGAMAFTHGDGEWVELYPVLELDAQGKVSALKQAARIDAAPGCREVLPTLR
jgi:hypothetical protein